MNDVKKRIIIFALFLLFILLIPVFLPLIAQASLIVLPKHEETLVISGNRESDIDYLALYYRPDKIDELQKTIFGSNRLDDIRSEYYSIWVKCMANLQLTYTVKQKYVTIGGYNWIPIDVPQVSEEPSN